jgi:glycosyltransferase involved in cell wall biosynthesis
MGIPELVEDNRTGLLVAPGDPAGLARAIDAILGDRDLAARLEAGARARARLYDWREVSAEVHALYAALAGDRPPARARPRAAGAALAGALWGSQPV